MNWLIQKIKKYFRYLFNRERNKFTGYDKKDDNFTDPNEIGNEGY